MLEPVGVEAVDERADERGPRRSGQALDEQIRRERREHEPRQEQNVVGDDGMETGGPQRHRRQRRQEHRIGERQRERLGIEDIAAEERPRDRRATARRPSPSATSKRADRRNPAPRPCAAAVAAGELRRTTQDAERRERRPGPPRPGGRLARIARPAGNNRAPATACPAGRSTPNGRTPDANHHRMASAIAAGIRARSAVAHRQPDAADLGVEAAGPRHDDRRRRRASGQASRGRWLPAVATLCRPISIVCRTCRERAHRHRAADSTSDPHRLHSGL